MVKWRLIDQLIDLLISDLSRLMNEMYSSFTQFSNLNHRRVQNPARNLVEYHHDFHSHLIYHLFLANPYPVSTEVCITRSHEVVSTLKRRRVPTAWLGLTDKLA